MDRTGKHCRGLTLIELLLAAALLAVCAVPIVEATTHAIGLAQEIETRTKATLLAQQEIEAAMGIAADDFDADLTKDSQDLGGGFRVTVTQDKDGLVKTITVEVGRDTSGNADLDADEVLAALKTRVADMTAY
jgi:prepilin-type N-terminal cleavage/methylation domain-containing protein